MNLIRLSRKTLIKPLSLDLDAMLMAEALALVLDAPLDDTADDTPPPAAALPDAEPVSPQAAVPPETDMLTLDLDAMLMGDAPAAAWWKTRLKLPNRSLSQWHRTMR